MICKIIRRLDVELYYVQGWEVTELAHHGAWSFLACRPVDPDWGAAC